MTGGDTPSPRPPRPAATVALLRDSPAGVETLLLERPVEAEFAASALVFPGGGVDPEDSDQRWSAITGLGPGGNPVDEVEPEAGSPDGRAFLVAAVREAFEETAILLGAGAGSHQQDGWGLQQRNRLLAGEVGFADLLQEHDLRLDLGEVVYFARWITPEALPVRFDARFYAAAATSGQVAVAAPGEIARLEWLTPAEALRRSESGQAYTLPPTQAALRSIGEHATVAEVLSGLRRQRDLAAILPRVVGGGPGVDGDLRVLMPGDPGYDS